MSGAPIRAGDVRLLNRAEAQARVLELLEAEDRYITEIARLRTLVEAAERHWQAHLRGEVA